MNIDNLVSMANQIGSFYETMPDRTQAREDIASHFQKFWNPRMRCELLRFIDSKKDSINEIGLLPIIIESIQLHRSLLGG